jgi:chaperonin GroEL (HSP60 family)
LPQGIDDVALKYFVEAGCLAVRRVDKDDLKVTPFLVYILFAHFAQSADCQGDGGDDCAVAGQRRGRS